MAAVQLFCSSFRVSRHYSFKAEATPLFNLPDTVQYGGACAAASLAQASDFSAAVASSAGRTGPVLSAEGVLAVSSDSQCSDGVELQTSGCMRAAADTGARRSQMRLDASVMTQM